MLLVRKRLHLPVERLGLLRVCCEHSRVELHYLCPCTASGLCDSLWVRSCTKISWLCECRPRTVQHVSTALLHTHAGPHCPD